MAKFCGSCGAQLSDNSAFCIQCGTAQNVATPPAPQPPPQPPVQPPPPAQPAYAQVNAPASAPPPVKSSGSGLKILLGILAVLFVGAVVVVGGLFYIGHRVVNKIKATAAENGLSLPSKEEPSTSGVLHRDLCGLLSKDDVSSAAGVPIVATHTVSDGCEYLAEGTSADMTARHMSAMMGAKGADNQTQDTVHKLAGGLFASQQQSEPKEQTADENGKVPVVVFSVDPNSARAQMQLNEKVLGALGPQSPKIEGIGDEAFDSAGGMMFVRKGDKLIRITYTMCPCTTEAIKPLARKLADAL